MRIRLDDGSECLLSGSDSGPSVAPNVRHWGLTIVEVDYDSGLIGARTRPKLDIRERDGKRGQGGRGHEGSKEVFHVSKGSRLKLG